MMMRTFFVLETRSDLSLSCLVAYTFTRELMHSVITIFNNNAVLAIAIKSTSIYQKLCILLPFSTNIPIFAI